MGWFVLGVFLVIFIIYFRFLLQCFSVANSAIRIAKEAMNRSSTQEVRDIAYAAIDNAKAVKRKVLWTIPSSNKLNRITEEAMVLAEEAERLSRHSDSSFHTSETKISDAEKAFEMGKRLAHGGDDARAVEWFRKAAELGHKESHYIMGIAYMDGRGVGSDSFEAFRWFRKAAEIGHAEAQFILAMAYQDNIDADTGINKDDVQAYQWYKKAAEQGYTEAQFYLGGCYDFGQGIHEDKEKAVQWYKKAAESGHADSQYLFGLSYFKGEGIEQNIGAARFWVEKAAANGVKEASEHLKKYSEYYF